jgi:hypothetical protein
MREKKFLIYFIAVFAFYAGQYFEQADWIMFVILATVVIGIVYWVDQIIERDSMPYQWKCPFCEHFSVSSNKASFLDNMVAEHRKNKHPWTYAP